MRWAGLIRTDIDSDGDSDGWLLLLTCLFRVRLHCGIVVLGSLMLWEGPPPHSYSVSKPDKPFVSPSWTWVEFHSSLCWSPIRKGCLGLHAKCSCNTDSLSDPTPYLFGKLPSLLSRHWDFRPIPLAQLHLVRPLGGCAHQVIAMAEVGAPGSLLSAFIAPCLL